MEDGVHAIQFSITGLNNQPSTFRHCVPCVHDQIHDDLLDLTWIGFYTTKSRFQIGLELDVFANKAFKHLHCLKHNCVEVQNFRFEHLLAAKHEELTG